MDRVLPCVRPFCAPAMRTAMGWAMTLPSPNGHEAPPPHPTRFLASAEPGPILDPGSRCLLPALPFTWARRRWSDCRVGHEAFSFLVHPSCLESGSHAVSPPSLPPPATSGAAAAAAAERMGYHGKTARPAGHRPGKKRHALLHDAKGYTPLPAGHRPGKKGHALLHDARGLHASARQSRYPKKTT